MSKDTTDSVLSPSNSSQQSAEFNFTKGVSLNGELLIPAVIQDNATQRILMLGWMNDAAYRETISSGYVTFFSRSKGRLWRKGESSGNTLKVASIESDCDKDALLIKAIPAGPTCHTGRGSCFDITGVVTDKPFGAFLSALTETIKQRRLKIGGATESSDVRSYTSELFISGIDKIVQKVGEEAVEVVIEGKNGDTERLLDESADLLFHLMVLLEARGLSLSDVETRLRSREK